MTDEQFAEHVKRTDRVIRSVTVFPNGNVAVGDQFDQQMPEYQGRYEEVKERLKAACPPDVDWVGRRD